VRRPVNLRDVPLDEAPQSREGHRFGRRLGVDAGAELTGVSVYELPPGEELWPYHYELHREEWLVVVAGEPTLRTPAGEQRVRVGDVVCFPLGAAGAHALWNDTGEPVRVLLLSSFAPGSYAVVQPDSDKLIVHDGDRRRIVRASAEVDSWEGEA
jgi:uncharacterized cupin superfamily protein